MEKQIKLGDVLSAYFLKRKDHLKKEFIAELKKTAASEAVYTDEFGSYKPGVFTYGAYIVEVDYNTDEKTWMLGIYPGAKNTTITSQVVKDIRYKFIPDDAMMAQMWGSRAELEAHQGVYLYEVPKAILAPKESESEQDEQE